MRTEPHLLSDAELAERSRLGHDRWDEMWDGVLHVAPMPSRRHQEVQVELLVRWRSLASARGLALLEWSIYDPEVPGQRDYRTPDLVLFREGDDSHRGVEGRAVLAVEVRSPDDESYRKLPFFERVGVEEVLIVDPRAVVIDHWVHEHGRLVERAPDGDGWTRLDALPTALRLEARSDHVWLQVDAAGEVTEVRAV